MAYLGNAPARSFISFERQVFTIVNSQTAYTLSHSVNNENDIRLVVNNIVQEPGSGKAYTASGTTLTLSAALTNGTDEMYCVFLGRATATNAPGAGSVNTAAITDLNVTTAKIAADAITEAKIADDAVESEHLNNNVISGQTELAATPADTDEFLVSDAGTLKRIDYSLIKGGGKIGQVVADIDTSARLTTSTSFVTASSTATVNITPSATSSKIYVVCTGNFQCNDGNDGWCATLYRDSSNLGNATSGLASGNSVAGVTTVCFPTTMALLDSPNTTSQVTYQLYVKVIDTDGDGGNVNIGHTISGSSNPVPTFITAFEVLA
jgi:hypothetical protein